MQFDQVRREFKKTLWGEELDNERYTRPLDQSFDLGFLHQFDGKKYRCVICRNMYEENETLFSENGTVCISCFQAG